jgi:ATP-dependent Clp protease ATP-binding subunit ClpC
MSEYMEKHAISKLIGSPPGYVGYEEGGQLTERIRRQPYSVILLDEIEKAHPDIANLLLQILEDGQLTDAYGNVVDFKNTLIIMTSNIGTKYLVTGVKVGFGEGKDHPAAREVEEMVLKELRREFSPEFINRVDDPIVFNPLGEEVLRGICRLLLDDVAETLRHRGLSLVADQNAVDWLLRTSGHDPHSGARPLRRTIQRHVEDAVSELLIASREPLQCVEVTVVGDELKVQARSIEPVGTVR